MGRSGATTVDVTLVTAPGEGESGIGDYTDDLLSHANDIDVEEVELQIRSKSPLEFLLPAIRIGRTQRDVIHIQHEYGMFGPMSLMTWIFFPVVFALASINDTPTVLTLHEAINRNHVTEPLAPLKRGYIFLINRLLVCGSDRVVFLSDTTKSEFAESTHPGNSTVVPHGVNVDRVVDIPQEEAKERFGYAPSDIVIVEPGYIEPRKGNHVFVELAERLPEYEFLIAGGASNVSYREYAEEITDSAPENLRVTGVLEEEMFHTAFGAADLAVLPYLRTRQAGIVNTVGQSGIFNRCITYELPVLGSERSYFEDLRQDWGCVDTFSTDDLDQATQRIREVINDETRQERLVTAMRAYGNEDSFEQVVEEHEKIYEDV